MAAARGRTDPPVAQLLLDQGYEFNFFQAVRLLLRAYPQKRFFSRLERPALPSAEVARFHAHQALSFPPSAIHEIKDDPNGGPVHMTVAFMGLTGPMGVLPLHYTEYLIERRYKKDRGPAAFFDLFNHRFIALFYSAWEKHHFPVQYEREGQAASAGFTQMLYDLIGMGTAGLRGRGGLQDRALLLYAGLLAQRPRSAAALAGMLRDYFGVPIEIEQFRGKWFPLAADGLSYLKPAGVHNQLGFGAVAGDQVWNQQARFRVRVGPVGFDRFRAFLPDGSAYAELMQLTSHFVDRALEFDMQLVLRAKEVPKCRLSDQGKDAPRLGLVSWLKTAEFKKDAPDAILQAAPVANRRRGAD